jgi:DNA-directed RNA polymerase sigma subunit (sigma70/sigma32)
MKEFDAKIQLLIDEFLDLQQRYYNAVKQRNQLIKNLKKDYTYKELGYRFKLTSRRVKQIVKGGG